MADIATGETTVLASWAPTAFFAAPTWSPDEGRVLFDFGEPGAPSLYVVKADGSSRPSNWRTAVPSRPIGRRIATASCTNPETTSTPCRPTASEPPRRLVPARKPDWSPDGSRIAVEAGASPNLEVWLIDPETGQGSKLVDGHQADMIASVWFQWSPTEA